MEVKIEQQSVAMWEKGEIIIKGKKANSVSENILTILQTLALPSVEVSLF